MEFILMGVALVLIGFMTLCWAQSDMIRDLRKSNKELRIKNSEAIKEISRTEHERWEQEIRANKLASKLYCGTEEIECYTCSNQQCGNGCRYTPGAKGCPDRRQEVKHGKWIERPFFLGTSQFCSLCGNNYGMPHEIFNYCPNCGANMEAE